MGLYLGVGALANMEKLRKKREIRTEEDESRRKDRTTHKEIGG
jgi:hypothetical protein